MAQPSIDIRLRRVNRIYREGEMVSGLLVLESKSEVVHQGLTLTMDGVVNMQLSSKSVGLFEAFYQSAKPIVIVNYSIPLAKPGRFPSGKTEIPFEMEVVPKQYKMLFETYHGVYINITYNLKAEMKRSMFAKDLTRTCEFLVEYQNPANNKLNAQTKLVEFKIDPELVGNVKNKHSLPRFCLSGHFDSTVLRMSDPLTGSIRVDACEAPIKSLELQLVRVETCGCAEGYAREDAAFTKTTEIQNIQVAEGDVPRSLEIPLHMVMPRLFTCPTVISNNFKIEFEVNVVLLFVDDHLVTYNFPILLTRY